MSIREAYESGLRTGNEDGRPRAGVYVIGEEYAMANEAYANGNTEYETWDQVTAWKNGYRLGYVAAASGDASET